MQQIMSQIRAAVDSYQLIQSGDRIAVGISGGKDSLVLPLCFSEYAQIFTNEI